jgi:hypothetical protein
MLVVDTMYWRAYRGTGLTIHDIRPGIEGRVEFTVWFSLFWIPLFPISSWSAVCLGEKKSDGIFDDTAVFAELIRLPHEWVGILQTFARGLFLLAVALAPPTYMIYRVQGRAANHVEMLFVFASAIWPVAIIIVSEKTRQAKLRKS